MILSEKIPIKQRILDLLAEERSNIKNRLPRWFYFDNGECGYHPVGKDLIYRSIFKLIIFTIYILIIMLIIMLGINTPVFITIRNLSSILNLNELLWITYGTILGIAGSVIFQNIKSGQSVESYFKDTIIYIIYFDVFFLVLNFVFWVVYLMNQ